MRSTISFAVIVAGLAPVFAASTAAQNGDGNELLARAAAGAARAAGAQSAPQSDDAHWSAVRRIDPGTALSVTQAGLAAG